MTDRRNLGKLLDRAVFWVDKNIFNCLKSLGVIVHRSLALDFLTVLGLKADKRAVCADPFTITLCKHSLAAHINKLIFKRRAACIDYQYIHYKHSSLYFTGEYCVRCFFSVQ